MSFRVWAGDRWQPFAVMMAVFFWTTCDAADVETRSIDVNDGYRPLDQVATEFEKRHGIHVSYEDGKYVHLSDLIDVTLWNRNRLKEFEADELPKRYLPRRGSVHVQYSVEKSTNLPIDPLGALEAACDSYNETENAGKFRVEYSGWRYYIVPSAIKDEDGQLDEVVPVLDTLVSFPEEEWSLSEHLQLIVSEITKATGESVSGYGPMKHFIQERIVLGAENERARDVLNRMFSGLVREITWSLLYSPVSGEEKWNLNVRYVTQRPWGKGLARRQWSEYHRLLGKEAYAKGLPVGDGSAMKSVVAALGDVDGDSDLDLVIGRNGENLLYLNDGSARPFADTAKGIPIGSNDEDATFSIGLVDMNGDGALDVVVGNYQSATRLYLNEGTERVFDGSDPGISIGGSDTAYASSIAVGDIDGDGDTDLVTGSFPYPRAPGKAGNRLYLNNGTAEPFSDIASGQLIGDDSNWTRSISLRDVDSDGDLDVISSGSGPTKLFVNDGDGQPFDSAGSGEQTRLVGTSESHEKTILVGDVNGDDAIDVIALGTAGVFMHLNSGGLHPFDSIENGLVLGEGLADQTQSVAVGDLDGDGDLDIVTGEGSRYLEHDSRTKVFLNRGFGTSSFLGFENTTIVGSEDKDDTHTVALGDLDGDGDLDIVAGSQFFTMVYLNDGGSRPFRGLKTGIPVGSELELNNRCIALGDIDGDGDLDLVGGNYGPDRIFFNDGDMETFGQRNAILGADDDKVSTRAIALGDVDGDGDIDIIAGGGNALCRLYLNDGDFDPFDGVGSGIAIGSSTKDIDALVLGDVDGDGDLDLIVADRRMRLYLNNGKSDPFRLSTPRVILSEGKTGRVRSLALGDVDGDGNVDLVVGHYRVNRVYLNNGRDVPFNRASVGTRAGRATDGKTLFVALGDLNGNGMLDLITGVDGENRVYLNEGDGTPFDGIVEKNLARRE